MGKTITQKSLWGKREITFDNQELKVSAKHWFFGERKRRYRLDEINPRYEIRTMKFSESGFFISVGFFVIFILSSMLNTLMMNYNPMVILGLLLLVFIVPKFFLKEQIFEFKTRDAPIWIYSNKLRRTEVHDFVEEIIAAIETYFKNKYGYVDSDLPKHSQFENYRWLLQNDFISEDEYLELKTKLKAAIGESDS